MCGIYATLAPTHDAARESINAARLDTLVPRGPDQQRRVVVGRAALHHTRLAITGASSATRQPFVSDGWCVAVNGEIYNHLKLGGCEGESDCRIISKLLSQHDVTEVCQLLDGVFSFVAYHAASGRIVIARDPIGVTPLFYGVHDDVLHVSSLMAALPAEVEPRIFPPGHTAVATDAHDMIMHMYVEPFSTTWVASASWNPAAYLDDVDRHTAQVRDLLRSAVHKRLMGDTPWGVLLSGGLDSTIVATLATAVAGVRADYPRVHSFSVGLASSPDLAVARRVANKIGTVHHELVYTVQDGIDALEDVIRAIETFDVTTVRASTPMWLLARFVRQNGVKMVLSGEGADELFAGYKYNEFCPSVSEMAKECIRKVDALHVYDCLRANKSMGDHGVECRVPFLDADVVNFAMRTLWPGFKMTTQWKEFEPELMEKWLLRRAFSELIPEEVTERAKAQFSDAVGDDWIRALKSHAADVVGDVPNAEELLYRRIFEKVHPGRSHAVVTGPSVACSSGAAIKWGNWDSPDPSGDLTYSST